MIWLSSSRLFLTKASVIAVPFGLRIHSPAGPTDPVYQDYCCLQSCYFSVSIASINFWICFLPLSRISCILQSTVCPVFVYVVTLHTFQGMVRMGFIRIKALVWCFSNRPDFKFREHALEDMTNEDQPRKLILKRHRDCTSLEEVSLSFEFL